MARLGPWAAGAVACLALSTASIAATIAAKPNFYGTTIGFATSAAYSGGTLTVVGPNEFAASANSATGLPSLNLAQFGKVPDGQYTYQLFAATAALVATVTRQNDGRANPNIQPHEGAAMSGVFQVKGGSIVAPSNAVE